MNLADDYILVEEIKPPEQKIELLNAREVQNSVVKAVCLAVGPGDPHMNGGRHPMPCKAGDIVLVHSGAGVRFKEDSKEFWFVFGARKDVLAVIGEA